MDGYADYPPSGFWDGELIINTNKKCNNGMDGTVWCICPSLAEVVHEKKLLDTATAITPDQVSATFESLSSNLFSSLPKATGMSLSCMLSTPSTATGTPSTGTSSIGTPSTGAHSIGDAARMIALDDADREPG